MGLGFSHLVCVFSFIYVGEGVYIPFFRSLEVVPELSGASSLFKLWLNWCGGWSFKCSATHQPWDTWSPSFLLPELSGTLAVKLAPQGLGDPLPKLQRLPQGLLAWTEHLAHWALRIVSVFYERRHRLVLPFGLAIYSLSYWSLPLSLPAKWGAGDGQVK